MNYFPNNDEEISLIKFIAKFQYLSINDSKYFFNTENYYKKRITRLIEKKYLRRIKSKLVLGSIGIEYVKMCNYTYTPLNRNQKYLSRLLYISNLGAFFYNSSTTKYTPSFAMKDKEMFTITARKFIGILNINGFEYLTYHISKEHDYKYILSVIYDIQKETKYKNVIILVDDSNQINTFDFTFGYNQVFIIEDNIVNRNKLKYLNSINWLDIIQNQYTSKIYLSKYKFCDYTDYQNKYICNFYLYDTEKINRIKQFLGESKDRNIDIICSSELKDFIKKQIPTANYMVVDIEKYIDRDRHIYE